MDSLENDLKELNEIINFNKYYNLIEKTFKKDKKIDDKIEKRIEKRKEEEKEEKIEKFQIVSKFNILKNEKTSFKKKINNINNDIKPNNLIKKQKNINLKMNKEKNVINNISKNNSNENDLDIDKELLLKKEYSKTIKNINDLKLQKIKKNNNKTLIQKNIINYLNDLIILIFNNLNVSIDFNFNFFENFKYLEMYKNLYKDNNLILNIIKYIIDQYNKFN